MADPVTPAADDFLTLVREAVLDPSVMKLVSPDGKPQVVALVSPDSIRDALADAEAEVLGIVYAALLRGHGSALAELARVCDEELDRSGRLLGRVREYARKGGV